MACGICNGTGLVPFKKGNKVVPFCWNDCICKVQEPEHYTEITLADFDFPCSDTFRSFYFHQYSSRDPGFVPSSTSEKLQIKPLAPEPIPTDRLDRMQGQLVALRDTLQDHLKSKKTAQPKVWQ